MKKSSIALLVALTCSGPAFAQQAAVVKNDMQIDGLDPGIKIFVREKMAQGNTRFANDNVVLFLHGATGPSTCDFDLQYKDYSWADWLVNRGYVVYMGDYRNYGGSTREAAMDEPANKNQPVTRSYLALRDIEAMVNHIKRTRNVQKVTLIGWSWGAMMGGYYTSLHSENVQKLVLYAPLYNFNDHTNLGPGSGLQNKRKPTEFNFALGAYRVASEAANTGRWNGEIPIENKDEYRDPALPAAFWNECLATDPTSNSRTPPSLRAPNGVLEDLILSGDRPATMECGKYLCTDPGDRRGFRYLVVPGGPRRPDACTRTRADEAQRPDQGCHAFRSFREEPQPVLRGNP